MSGTSASSTAPPRILEPPAAWGLPRIRQVWQKRELLYFLTWRDVKVRYAQAFMGFSWAVLQPVLMMTIFSIFFGKLARIPSDGLPYPVFALSGLVPWTFVVNAVGDGSLSLVENSNLVSKVYFPRLVVPLAAMAAWLPDIFIATAVLGVVAGVYGVAPAPTAVLLPLLVVAAWLVAASVTVWLSALNVAYRDVRFALSFFLQTWLFATPVVYPASLVPSQWRWVLALNPMAGVVEAFRWAMLGQPAPSIPFLAVSFGVTLVLGVSGLLYFRRVEAFFADVI